MKTVNLATLFVIAWIIADVCTRIFLHGFNSCNDEIMLSVLCYSFKNNVTLNPSSTVPTNNTITTDTGKEKCFSYPTLRILILGILILECLKIFLGFFRIVSKYKRKHRQISHNLSANNEVQQHNDNQVDQDIQLSPELKQMNNKNGEVSKMSSSIITVEPVIEEGENKNESQHVTTACNIEDDLDDINNVIEVREVEEAETSNNQQR
jgi:hypothetical protein